MITHAQVQEWYETWFGAQRDANSQMAIAQLHDLLGTAEPKLEDKTFASDLKKGIINIKETE